MGHLHYYLTHTTVVAPGTLYLHNHTHIFCVHACVWAKKKKKLSQQIPNTLTTKNAVIMNSVLKVTFG